MRASRIFRFLPWRCEFGQFLIAMFLIPTLYLAYVYNVWEYARTTPFAYFTYPLEVDLNNIVDGVLQGEKVQEYPINPSKYPFVINSDRKCKNDEGEDEDVTVVFLIKSKLDNFDQRQMIRKTWGHEYIIPYVKIRRVFLLGTDPSNKKIQHRIGLEAQEYDDIVQQYFIDHYFNNTIKLMMGFQWAASFCRGARYLAFIDDDYYVNTHNLVKLLQNMPEQKTVNTILGYIWNNAMPIRIRGSKWYISLEEYPFRLWPPYPTAGSFFVPSSVAERIAVGMQYVKYLRFDDVFIGIVCHKLGVKMHHIKQLHFYDLPYEKRKYRDVIAAHGYRDIEDLNKVFKEQQEYRQLLEKLKN